MSDETRIEANRIFIKSLTYLLRLVELYFGIDGFGAGDLLSSVSVPSGSWFVLFLAPPPLDAPPRLLPVPGVDVDVLGPAVAIILWGEKKDIRIEQVRI